MNRVLAVLLVMVALTAAGLAKGLLEIKHESVYQSRFCQRFRCAFLERGGGHTNGIDYDQFLYRLRNGLYFFVSRFTPNTVPYRLENVRSVSLAAYATQSGLRKLRAFLREFVGQAVIGQRVPWPFDFDNKCASPNLPIFTNEFGSYSVQSIAAFSARTHGFVSFSQHPERFRRSIQPRPDGAVRALRIMCARSGRSPQLLTITLYWGAFDDPTDFADILPFFRGGTGRLPTPF
jgi:hypothetical protein